MTTIFEKQSIKGEKFFQATIESWDILCFKGDKVSLTSVVYRISYVLNSKNL